MAAENSKRIKVDQDFFVLLYSEGFGYVPRVLHNKYLTSLEEAKLEVETYYKDAATGPSKDMFKSKFMRKYWFDCDDDKEFAQEECEKYKFFYDKTMRDSKFPWTDILEYYREALCDANQEAEDAKIPVVNKLEIVKLSR